MKADLQEIFDKYINNHFKLKIDSNRQCLIQDDEEKIGNYAVILGTTPKDNIELGVRAGIAFVMNILNHKYQ